MKLSNEIRDKLFEKLMVISREEHELEKLRAKLKVSTERILTGYLFGAENAFNSMEKELPTDFNIGDCNDVIWREGRDGDLKYLEVVGFTSEIINDDKMKILARDIAKKIETELDYPGQIKVSVIRESRHVDYAK